VGGGGGGGGGGAGLEERVGSFGSLSVFGPAKPNRKHQSVRTVKLLGTGRNYQSNVSNLAFLAVTRVSENSLAMT